MTRTGTLMPHSTANHHLDVDFNADVRVAGCAAAALARADASPDSYYGAERTVAALARDVTAARYVDVRVRDPRVDWCPLDEIFDDEEAAMKWAARDHQQHPDRHYEARVRWQVRADGSPDGWQPILLAAPEPDPRAEALAHLAAAVTALRLASGAFIEADNSAHANEALAVATALGRLKAAADTEALPS